MMDYNYIIIKLEEKDKLNLTNYLQDSWDTLNTSDDKVWGVLKYSGELPVEVQTLSQYRGPFDNQEILSIIYSVEWRKVPEWSKQ